MVTCFTGHPVRILRLEPMPITLNIKNGKLVVIFLALTCLSPNLFSQARGGSNYLWYQLSGCNKEPFGAIYNYSGITESIINGQLQTMYNNGQRRLRIPIFHARGLETGTIMDSTGGHLSPTDTF